MIRRLDATRLRTILAAFYGEAQLPLRLPWSPVVNRIRARLGLGQPSSPGKLLQ
jgi:hypothetical protein